MTYGTGSNFLSDLRIALEGENMSEKNIELVITTVKNLLVGVERD